MPELPEVETVRKSLQRKLQGKTIVSAQVYWDRIIEFPGVSDFVTEVAGQTIIDMKRRGKWLLFELNDYYLLSHLRMEGKYFFRQPEEKRTRHQHVVFALDDGQELRYQDTRKFGKMHLIPKEIAYESEPLCQLGPEPDSSELTVFYLKEKLKKKTIPIKTALLDQTIVVGIGNIYVNEVLFLSQISPLRRANEVTEDELQTIIDQTRIVLKQAIDAGGTTIRSYTPEEGVTGLFQQELYVHTKEGEPCPNCGTPILKIQVNGRGTYYCPVCQK